MLTCFRIKILLTKPKVDQGDCYVIRVGRRYIQHNVVGLYVVVCVTNRVNKFESINKLDDNVKYGLNWYD